MGKKHYALPKRVIDKARKDYGEVDDLVNIWGVDYLQRMQRSYHGRSLDLDTQSRLYTTENDWLYSQGEYLRIVSVQLDMLIEILQEDVPLWHCELVFPCIHTEVYGVPALKREIVHIVVSGWHEHLHRIDTDEEYPDGGTRVERNTRIMRSYPLDYHRYFTIPMADKVNGGI